MSRRERINRPDPSREVAISKAASYVLRHGAQKEGLKMDSQGYANVADLLAWRKLRAQSVTLADLLYVVSSSQKQRFSLLHIPSAAPSVAPTAISEDTPSETLPTDPPSEGTPGNLPSKATAPSTLEEALSATETAITSKDPNPSNYLIRATQGHSLKTIDHSTYVSPLTLNDPSALPTTVVHGTFHAFWPRILATGGLKPMGRVHVHFATGPSLASVLPGVEGTVGTNGSESERPNGTEEDEGAEEATSTPAATEVRGDGTVISGMRSDAQILVYINLRKALEAGVPFWRSENGVILSEGQSPTEGGKGMVGIEFFNIVVERKVPLGVLWQDGKVVKELPRELAKKGAPRGKGGGGGRGKEQEQGGEGKGKGHGNKSKLEVRGGKKGNGKPKVRAEGSWEAALDGNAEY